MTTKDRAPSPTPVLPRGEGAIADSAKTTVQAESGKKPNWRCGAPCGNQNARKPVNALSALEAKVRDMKKRARQAIRSAARAAC
jgi:hypothetical protein